jgi:hypothetical protein
VSLRPQNRCGTAREWPGVREREVRASRVEGVCVDIGGYWSTCSRVSFERSGRVVGDVSCRMAWPANHVRSKALTSRQRQPHTTLAGRHSGRFPFCPSAGPTQAPIPQAGVVRR